MLLRLLEPAIPVRYALQSKPESVGSKPFFFVDIFQAKKIKCSGTRPCRSCAKRGRQCLFDSQYTRGRPPTPPCSTPIDNAVDMPVVIVPTPVSAIGASAPTDNRESPAQDDPLTRTQSRSSPELDSAEVHGQYVDTTSGLSFLHRARNRLSSHHKVGEADQQECNTTLQPLIAAGDRPIIGLGPGVSGEPTLLSGSCFQILHRQDALELLDLYFDVCVATYKPLHRPSVQSWYETMATNASAGRALQEDVGNARLATLFGVFAVATFHRQRSRGFADDETSLGECDSLFQESTRLTDAEVGLPLLESAQARLVQVFYLLMTCRMNRAWYTFGTLLQIISALGMHRRDRKGRNDTSTQDYVYKQCRKRTFWTAYILDKYLGVVMGRPRHFHDDDLDQDYPDCINDADMSVDGSRLPDDSNDDCAIDAFVCNIKLSRIVGRISHELYSIKVKPAEQRRDVTLGLGQELENWHANLPPFLSTVKPSTLIRSFRRQAIALKIAYCHAVMHLYRPFLLNHSTSQHHQASSTMRSDAIRHCIVAAEKALRTVDSIAKEGPIFHAFWWTHYVTFCALAVVYVWKIQQEKPHDDIPGIVETRLFELAERCHVHLGQATAMNSPSRRYSVILEELRVEARASNYAVTDTQSNQVGVQPDLDLRPNDIHSAINESNAIGQPIGGASGNSLAATFGDSFVHWQPSDWLDLDAFVSCWHLEISGSPN